MTTNLIHRDAERYRPFGLVANPFLVAQPGRYPTGISLETQAASNRLLVALAKAKAAERAKPIVVIKSADVPSSYPSNAISAVEAALINDASLNIVHAYIQLYMMRKGRVRSTLGIVGERVAFRSFDETLARYLALVLEEPDDKLASYQVLGADELARFAEAFRADPVGVTDEYFGKPRIEKRPELARVTDIRLSGLEADVEESESSPEIDSSVGDAPGAGVGLASADEADEDDEQKRQAVVDYLIEYTAAHLSKVVARGLRVYRERGMAAMTTEWNITKAPRKTLKAVAEFASARFDKLAVIYDGFDSWAQISEDLRHTIVVTLSEMRWMLERTAVFVLLLEEGVAPELEEQFGAAERIRWDFPALVRVQKDPDVYDAEIVGDWLTAASLSDETSLTLDDPVLAVLAEKADMKLDPFVTMASAAIENAADRSVSTLDDEALSAGLGALEQEPASDG